MDWVVFVADLIVTGILLYALQKILDERASRRLEEFKAEIRAGAFERETRFEELHAKRAEVIAELFKKLVDTRSRLKFLIGRIGASDVEIGDRPFPEITEEFWDYFQKHRVVLPEELCEHIDEFLNKTESFLYNLAITHLQITNPHEAVYDKVKYGRKFTEEVEPVVDKLEKEFRKLLGG